MHYTENANEESVQIEMNIKQESNKPSILNDNTENSINDSKMPSMETGNTISNHKSSIEILLHTDFTEIEENEKEETKIRASNQTTSNHLSTQILDESSTGMNKIK